METFLETLEGLDPADYPQAAREIVMRLSDYDLLQHRLYCSDEEPKRRQREADRGEAQAELVAELQKSGQLSRPATATMEEATEAPDTVPAWENPLTDHARMYLQGAVVTHNGRIWQSTHPGLNHWEPGATGVDERIWADITDQVHPTEPEENTASPGAIPFGPGLPVQPGDIVEFEGARYRVLSAHTTASHWPPTEAHSLFQRL